MHDAVVVGGGFYGTTIANYLASARGFRDILIVERENQLFARASFHNQARVHNGYHYPRSYTTAYRSHINLPRFVRQYRDAVTSDFTKIYAIARRSSKVTAAQFARFCREIGVALEPAPRAIRQLFETHFIEDVFVVDEYAFNANLLRSMAASELAVNGVDVRFGQHAIGVTSSANGRTLAIRVDDAAGNAEVLECRYVFNCTYSGLNQLGGHFPGTHIGLKHEITEMVLLEMPDTLRNLGVTIMDGPFFSTMPFPSAGCHSLSHVRYTPRFSWHDAPNVDPYAVLQNAEKASRGNRMVRDAARYLPAILGARLQGSLFEVKTVLIKNEADDGRPILFERHADLPGCYSILGGKIDNIFDILEKLDAEALTVG